MSHDEHRAQAALVQWLAAKGVLAMAIPNAARRNVRQAAYLKAEGMAAGAPDLILARRTPGGAPCAIEMKRAKGARVSPVQEAMHELLRAEGWVVLVCYGLDDAIHQVSHVYGWPVPQCFSSSPPPAPRKARATGRRTASGATSTPATSPPSSRRTPTRVRRVDLP